MTILFGSRPWFGHQELMARKEIVHWLGVLAPWNGAITLTFHRFNSLGHPFTETIGIRTLNHFQKILNQKCLGRARMEKGQSIGFAVALGLGDYDANPHAHISIATPPSISFGEVHDIAVYAARRTDWINEQMKIIPYRDLGWLQYMTDHGTDNLLLQLTTPLQTD